MIHLIEKNNSVFELKKESYDNFPEELFNYPFNFKGFCTEYKGIAVSKQMQELADISDEEVQRYHLNFFIKEFSYFLNLNGEAQKVVLFPIGTAIINYIDNNKVNLLLLYPQELMVKRLKVKMDPVSLAILTTVGKWAATKATEYILGDIQKKIFGPSFEEKVTKGIVEINKQLGEIENDTKNLLISKFKTPLINAITFLTKKLPTLENEENETKNIIDYIQKYKNELDDSIGLLESELTQNALNSCSYLIRTYTNLYCLSVLVNIVLSKIYISILEKTNNTDETNSRIKTSVILTSNLVTDSKSNVNNYLNTLKSGRIDKISNFIDEKSEFLGMITSFKIGFTDEFESKMSLDPFRGEKINKIEKSFFIPGPNNGTAYLFLKPGLEEEYNNHKSEVEKLFENHVSKPLKYFLSVVDEIEREKLADIKSIS